MCQKPPAFFGAPFIFNGIGMPSVGGDRSLCVTKDEQQASFAIYEPPSGISVHPTPSAALARVPPETERRQSTESALSIQSTSEASVQPMGQNETERPGVPVAVYVDLSVLRETQKGRNALIKPNSTSEPQTSGNWGNHWGGSDSRRHAQKRYN
jgi:hypothetical protein